MFYISLQEGRQVRGDIHYTRIYSFHPYNFLPAPSKRLSADMVTTRKSSVSVFPPPTPFSGLSYVPDHFMIQFPKAKSNYLLGVCLYVYTQHFVMEECFRKASCNKKH